MYWKKNVTKRNSIRVLDIGASLFAYLIYFRRRKKEKTNKQGFTLWKKRSCSFYWFCTLQKTKIRNKCSCWTWRSRKYRSGPNCKKSHTKSFRKASIEKKISIRSFIISFLISASVWILFSIILSVNLGPAFSFKIWIILNS